MAHAVTAPAMQRAQRLLDQRVAPAVLTGRVPFAVESTAETFDPVAFDVARSAPRTAFEVGSKWGHPWHSRWFCLVATVPAHLGGRALVAQVDLGFVGRGDGFQVEGLAWVDGRIVTAIQPDRRSVPLGIRAAGDTVEVWIEAAATPIIAGKAHRYGPTPLGDPATASARALYTLRTADLAAIDEGVADLALALHTVIDLALDLPESSQRARCFAALEKCGAAFDVGDPSGSARAARTELDAVLTVGNGPGAHRIVAAGHAHLDTAWLWPIRETRRKAVRTFANAVHLLRANPDMVYCHSQAQHYAWVAEDAPDLFAEVGRLVADGRWEPVGGMWVETDLNLPSGESLLRQMVQGQRAFGEWFDLRCDGAFLPDDFGYPGGLPQIVAHGGARWFFTQKLSWNETNPMPHHSFWWEGIDGTRVFTHFSPVDTYNALNTPSQLRFADRNFRDHAGAGSSLVLYGHGDGGGGPTQEMVDRVRLAHDLEGVPRTSFGRVGDFHRDAEREYGASAPVWTGEMYFEKHRGTYSTQVGTKQGNRAAERALHELELWSAAAGTRSAGIDALWRGVLTQQFHDIIPGSSIAWVHRDAETEFARVVTEIESRLGGLLDTSGVDPHVMNPAPVPLRGVVDIDGEPRWVDVAPFSWAAPTTRPAAISPVTVDQNAAVITVSNGIIHFSIGVDGTLLGIENGSRNLLGGGRARFVLRNDTPAEYDAWDIDRADADGPEICPDTSTAGIAESSDLRGAVECRHTFGASTITVTYTLTAGSRSVAIALDADWQAEERRLQWVLPTALRSPLATSGTQFGHVVRARHANTSWDAARFEVCGHRWTGVGEPGFGAAILADGPRGYDVRGNELRLTVLRSPGFPDPRADRGHQRIEWAVALTDGDPLLDGIEHDAALMAHPPRIVRGVPGVGAPDAVLEVPGALISCVKPADDGSGDLIVRLWETRGASTDGVLRTRRASATDCNALEEPVAEPITRTDEGIAITLRPFQIRTLRLPRS